MIRSEIVDTLRVAAALLEDWAARATPGPWTVYDRGVSYEINELPEVHDGTQFRHDDARWIAAMNPTTAAPLVAWLRGTALDRESGGFWSATYEREALEFAHRILAAAGKEGE